MKYDVVSTCCSNVDKEVLECNYSIKLTPSLTYIFLSHVSSAAHRLVVQLKSCYTIKAAITIMMIISEFLFTAVSIVTIIVN